MRFMEGREHGGPLVARSTIMGVLVAGLTTIAGFGSLMLADHRGIFGLGLLLTLGTTASLIASLIVLPVLLRLRQRTGGPTPAPSPQPRSGCVPVEPVDYVGGREMAPHTPSVRRAPAYAVTRLCQRAHSRHGVTSTGSSDLDQVRVQGGAAAHVGRRGRRSGRSRRGRRGGSGATRRPR